MFFIFGYPRSGTTLLAQCLDAHPEVVVPGETDFIVPMAFLFNRRLPPEAGREMLTTLITRSFCSDSVREYLSDEAVREVVGTCEYTLSGVLEALYAAIARSAGAKLAGDKSPNDLAYIGCIAAEGGIPPGTKILHIVRDVRDVVVSLRDQDWGERDALYVAQCWASSNLVLFDGHRHDAANYLLVRYEELAAAPEGVLRKCCAVLEIDYDPAMIDHTTRHERYREMPHHQRLFEPISTRRVGVYKTRLPPAEQGACAEAAAEALEAFGYRRI